MSPEQSGSQSEAAGNDAGSRSGREAFRRGEGRRPGPEGQARKRWAVVGGGMLGLTLALRLRAQGKEVTVFETDDSFPAA